MERQQHDLNVIFKRLLLVDKMGTISCNFGFKDISLNWKQTSAIKQYINNNINPLYTDILPSGKTKQQLLNAMRKTLWFTECVTKAKRSAYSKLRGSVPTM